MRAGAILHAALGALLALFCAVPALAGENAVTELRVEARGLGLRVVLETDAPAEGFRLFALEAPRRIVADLPDTEWKAPPIEDGDLPDGAAVVRAGAFMPGTSRLVLELERPMRVAQVHAGDRRFVLTLVPASEAEFAASAGWPEDSRWEPGAAPIPKVAGEGGLLVALDPGHGGIDPGAVVDGSIEKDLVLAFARTLSDRLAATGRYRVFLTREDDSFVPLDERVRRARAAGANIIISLHADVVTEGEAQGTSVYTLPDRAAAETADELAEEQNRVDALVGANLSGEGDVLTHVLVELAQRGTQLESARLAEALVEAMRPTVGVLRSRPHRAVGFRVLRAPDTPSVLIELGYLSSEADRAKLVDPVWHERASAAILSALDFWSAGARPDFVRERPGG